MLNFSRDITSNGASATRREWLVTNGIGGYAMGTIANGLTRRYHGLLVAALKPPLGRTVLVSKVDETVTYDDQTYPLFTNQWGQANAPFEPKGFYHLEQFRLEDSIPTWTFACADARLEKRVWMTQGENTTYVRYDLRQGTLPMKLSLRTFVNYKDFHQNIHAGDWAMQVEAQEKQCQIVAFDGATPFYLFSDQAQIEPEHDWYYRYFLQVEAARGLDALGDHLCIGQLMVTLHLGQSVTLIASTHTHPSLDSSAALRQQQAHAQNLIKQSQFSAAPLAIQQLVLAADQFIVRRLIQNQTTDQAQPGHSIIAGYPWFSDWGRDTMISLSGLTLTTGRPEIAASILRTFAQFVDQGMLPNRFPDDNETPEYNTVDATLWYVEAIRAYYALTSDENLLRDLYPILQDIIGWHQRGTRYNIHVDETDGLLYAGEPGVQLTWMDAKVGDWVVTPRIGKPVEINALWYNALCAMITFSQALGQSSEIYQALAEKALTGFARFWAEALGYCYDVLDGPEGHDRSLRPNQLFAVSLSHSPLKQIQQKYIVDLCARRLLTSMGLRTLTPDHPDYRGQFQGGPPERDAAYHQGTVWPWLMGAFIEAHWRIYRNDQAVRAYLQPLLDHRNDHGVGSLSEVATGDAPHYPKACIAQAWSVAEVLRVWQYAAK